MQRERSDILIIGMALFAMFFGAGSLIFPPYLGMTSGPQWFQGFLCFFFTDVGLAFVTIVAMIRSDGHMSVVTGPVGRIPSMLINTAVVLCIGPLLATPRTAATTFEMFVKATFPSVESPLISSVIYFAVVVLLTIRPSRVIDILGKMLTPSLFLGLLILVVKGVMHPVGPLSETPMLDNVIKEGIIAGYQAMDVFGGLVFAIIVVSAVKQRGYHDYRGMFRVSAKACVIAGSALFAVYCGLTYLGATASTLYSVDVNQASLLVSVTESLLGRLGVIILGVVVALACLTTAIGLTSSAAAYFEELSGGKLGYKPMVVTLAILSLLVANLGLSKIISIAVPILSLLYPAVLTLVVLSFIRERIHNLNIYRFSVAAALFISTCSVIDGMGVNIAFIHAIPLAEYSMQWILPAIAGGLVGACVPGRRQSVDSAI